MVFTKWIWLEEEGESLTYFAFGEICLKSLLGSFIFTKGGVWLVTVTDLTSLVWANSLVDVLAI